MKIIEYTLLTLIPTLGSSFHAVRKAVDSNHHVQFRRSGLKPWRTLAPRPAAIVALAMSSPEGPRDLPRLPPADYSKDATGVGNLGESSAEFGHVMTNRKLTLSFTCNVCEGTNSYQINRVAFMRGIVVVQCQNCNQSHLIADNLGKMDFPWFGRNLEEYMAKKGTPVKRVVLTKDGLTHVEVEVPGADYPEIQSEVVNETGFDVTSVLPGAHVGDSALLDLPPLKYGGVPRDELEGGDCDGVERTGSEA